MIEFSNFTSGTRLNTCIGGDFIGDKMKEIKLTKGAVAIVDNEDYEKLKNYSWYLSDTGYASTTTWDKVSKKSIHKKMHRMIIGAESGMDVDHINGNRLDNRKSNLRVCTRAENLKNSSIRSDNSSGYKGVSFFKPIKKWRAYIGVNGKHIPLGYFDDPIEAAKAYNKAALELHGEFAKLNII